MTVVPLLVRFQFHSRLGCRGKAILQYLAIYRNRNVRPTGRQSFADQIADDVRLEIIDHIFRQDILKLLFGSRVLAEEVVTCLQGGSQAFKHVCLAGTILADEDIYSFGEIETIVCKAREISQ